jgi:penicillin-binding protein 2
MINDQFSIDIEGVVVGGRRRRSSSNTSEAISWQEGLLPSAKGGLSDLSRAGKSGSGSSFGGWRLLPPALLLVSVILVLVWRLFSLQVIYGRQNFLLSEGNRLLSQVVRPERGVIYDRHHQVLARNQPGFSVFWELGDGDSTLVPSLPFADVAAKISAATAQQKTRVLLQGGVDRDTVLRLEANRERFPHLLTEVSPVREYLDGALWAHVLGFVGEASLSDLETFADWGMRSGDSVGKTNLERSFQAYLSGSAGEQLLEVDAFGYRFEKLNETPAVPGYNLLTTLDGGLQKAAMNALAEGVEKSGAVGGAVVVQRVSDGEILALVSWPSFDANLFARGISLTDYQKLLDDPRRPLFNRAVSGAFPPGSTFKVVMATAALEEGVITPQTVIDDKGSISVGGRVFKGWAPEGLGPVSLKTAIAKSSDIYFYTVGGGYGGQRGLGVEKIAEWAKHFGLGQETGVALSAETEGLVPDPAWRQETYGEPWYIGHTYNISIGQGDLLVTPLQLNNLVVAIANGGTLFRPRLVKQILAAEGYVLQEFESEILRSSLASPSALVQVREGMRAACQPGGTAYPLFDFKVPVAGKTGTSESGRKDKTHAWFTAFAPFDAPEIAVTVFLEEGGEGSHDAAPVVRKILEEYFK